MKTSISFLKSNSTREETIQKITETNSEFIHVDVMDGEFVPRRVLEVEEVKGLLANSQKELDIHLMVKDPKNYINEFSNLNAKYITIHVEIEEDINELINLIHSYGIGAGIALNPKTNVEKLLPYLDHIEYVLIMGVNPGEGGQSLIFETLDKIKMLQQLREQYNYHYQISLDGGVNGETKKLMNGLDIIVSGSYVCMSNNYQEKVDSLRC